MQWKEGCINEARVSLQKIFVHALSSQFYLHLFRAWWCCISWVNTHCPVLCVLRMFTFSTMPYACLWPSHLFTMFKITHNTYKGKFFILTISSALSTSPMANGVSTPILPYLFSPVELCWCFGCSHGNTLHFQSVSPPTEWFLREELILSPIPYNMPNIYTT